MNLSPYLEGLLAKASSELKAANGTQFDQKIGGLDGWRHLIIALLANSGSLMTLTPYLEDVVADAEDSDATNARQFDADIGGVDGWRHLIAALLGQLTTEIAEGGSEVAGMPRSYLAGLTLAKAAGTRNFTVAPGACRDSTNAEDIVLPATLEKVIFSAWVAGTGQGSDDGQYAGEPSNETIHVYVIKNSTSGVVDVLTTTEDVVVPILPTGFTHYRRIGAMYCAGSGDLVPFTQIGDEFLLATPTNTGTAILASGQQDVVLGVPRGISVKAICSLRLFTSPDKAALAKEGVSITLPSDTMVAAEVDSGAALVQVWTNLAKEAVVWGETGGGDFIVSTFGWIDRRGRDD